MSYTMTTASPATTARDSSSRVQVHFDDTAVLIPEPIVQSRMPRLVKKSYSLPRWRKRPSSNVPAHSGDLDGPLASSPPEEKGAVITVPMPRSVFDA